MYNPADYHDPTQDELDQYKRHSEVFARAARERTSAPVARCAASSGSVPLDYAAFVEMAERSVQSATENACGDPPEGYHELEGKAVAVADDCFLAGIEAMKTAMLNEMFDLLNGTGPISPNSEMTNAEGRSP